MLRLVESWYSLGRTVIGDSWFSSVNTCERLLQHEIHFMGIMKTVHRRFPKVYLVNWEK